MTAALVTAALIAGALAHTLLVPRLLTRWTSLRRAPGEALALWQAVSLTGVVCALLAAPVAALTFGSDRPRLLAAAVVVSVLMLARLLWSGHRIGTDLRRMRAQNRELVDLVGDRLHETTDGEVPPRRRGRPEDRIAVVAHGNPTAYCLPGRKDRIVLSQGTVERLDPPQLRAVLAHEQAHLRQRHDLLLELFTVLHEAVPPSLRAPTALREVHLLTEVLADRAAVASGRTDHTTLAHALVSMAGSAPAPGTDALTRGTGALPSGTRASADDRAGTTPYPVRLSAGHEVADRLRVLAAPEAGPALRLLVLTLAAASLALPWALLLLLLR